MKCRAAIEYFGVLYLSIALFWYAIGADIIQAEFSQFDLFLCDYAAMCATSKPSSLFAVRSKGMCTFECLHKRESCVGVNYLAMNSTCELFGDNPTSFSQTVNGCQYMQVSSLWQCWHRTSKPTLDISKTLGILLHTFSHIGIYIKQCIDNNIGILNITHSKQVLLNLRYRK